MSVTVHTVSPPDFDNVAPHLAEIVADGVNGGAAISFMQPYALDDGLRFWREAVFPDAGVVTSPAADSSKPPAGARVISFASRSGWAERRARQVSALPSGALVLVRETAAQLCIRAVGVGKTPDRTPATEFP